MPFGSLKPVCFRCNISESSIWRKVQNSEEFNKEEIICNDCSIQLKKTRMFMNLNKNEESDENKNLDSVFENKKTEIKNEEMPIQNNFYSKVLTRKSTRSKKGANKGSNFNQRNLLFKGKGRRHVFKRNVYKSPSAINYPITRDSVYYEGINYHVGDIVSMIDAEDGCTYFAQIRGFLQDQYCEKSAAVSWLVPNEKKEFKPISEFNPADYVLGPEEDIPRKLECMEFVCRAPSDYFKASNSPYSTSRPLIKNETGFVWTRLGPILFKKNQDEMFL